MSTSFPSAAVANAPLAAPISMGRQVMVPVSANMHERSRLVRPLTIFVMHASDMLTDHLPHGDGLIAWNFIRGLAVRGHEIHAAVTRVEIHGEIPPNVRLHRINSGDAMFGRLQFMYRMRQLFERLQRVVPFDLAVQMNPVFTGVSLGMLFCGVPVVLGTYVASWPAEEIKATMTDGIAPGSMGQKVLAALQQLSADRLLLTLPAAMSRLPLRRLMKRKVRWVAHGIDTDMFSPAADAFSDRRMEAEQTQPTVLFVANIVKRKGIDPLVRAWARVVREIPEARLSVVGDGPDLPGMRALAEELGVSGNIDFRGAARREAVPRLMQDHAVYVLPSFGEPYAGSLLEAMSCGRPVVITNAGGLPEMTPEDGGIRVPVRDAEALADAMVTLLRDPERRRRAGQLNRNTMVNTVTWPRVLDTLEEHYGELLHVPVVSTDAS